jgi:hypothetical protein
MTEEGHPVPARKPIRSENRFADEAVGAIASERYSCKKERLPTSKRVRLFGRHNSSRGSTFVAMIKTTLGQNARRRRRGAEAAQSHTAVSGEHLRNDSNRSLGRLSLAAAPTRATIPSFAVRVSTI